MPPRKTKAAKAADEEEENVAKRSKVEVDSEAELEMAQSVNNTKEEALVMVPPSSSSGALIVQAPAKKVLEGGRTSSLRAATMMLTGHEGAIYTCAFSPDGQSIASGSMDKNIFLWDVYGECKNYNVLSGHKNAVLELKWMSSNSQLVSCSADKTVQLWDAHRGVRVRKFTEHSAIVNACSVAKDTSSLFASASDDCTAILWDARSKRPAASMYHEYQVTCVCASKDGMFIYTGGIDNIIRRWDLRNGEPEKEDLCLAGHADTVTGLSLSPDGDHLLSNSMDASLRCWDVRPFASNEANRCEKMYHGLRHGAEKNLLKCAWSPDGVRVTGGSADRNVHIWDADTCKPLYLLPGHKGSVNEIAWHPQEPIIASCGSDRVIYLGELC